MDTITAIHARRTAHCWRPTPVDDAVVQACLDAAHQAPCHKHTWPWRFVVVGPRARGKITELGLRLKSRDKPLSPKKLVFLRTKIEAPGALVVVTQVRADDPERAREDYAACAAAIQNMILAAIALGVHTKWSTGGLTRHIEARQILSLPDGEDVVGFVWFGEPLELPTVGRPPVEDLTRRVP